MPFIDFLFMCRNEIFRHRSADVARCWAKYGLLLLEFSRDRLMKKAEEDDEDSGSPTTDLSKQTTSDKSETSQGRYESVLNLFILSKYSNVI